MNDASCCTFNEDHAKPLSSLYRVAFRHRTASPAVTFSAVVRNPRTRSVLAHRYHVPASCCFFLF